MNTLLYTLFFNLEQGHGNTSPSRCPGGLWNSRQSHLNRLPLTWRSSDSTPTCSRVTELFTLGIELFAMSAQHLANTVPTVNTGGGSFTLWGVFFTGREAENRETSQSRDKDKRCIVESHPGWNTTAEHTWPQNAATVLLSVELD